MRTATFRTATHRRARNSRSRPGAGIAARPWPSRSTRVVRPQPRTSRWTTPDAHGSMRRLPETSSGHRPCESDATAPPTAPHRPSGRHLAARAALQKTTLTRHLEETNLPLRRDRHTSSTDPAVRDSQCPRCDVQPHWHRQTSEPADTPGRRLGPRSEHSEQPDLPLDDARFVGRAHSPVEPSIRSRTMSAWPL